MPRNATIIITRQGRSYGFEINASNGLRLVKNKGYQSKQASQKAIDTLSRIFKGDHYHVDDLTGQSKGKGKPKVESPAPVVAPAMAV
jgi:uncharacterized protein YegP (UPF0339 family)